ncbi:oxygen-dependent tRNA uridine(34) hydroxylase TrhO [Cytobacillus purgationiresistens]|uniref:tRNA uridine(34) hydroxylase n=1 Tax=Cytobacillus purgationiresistens TaxID=863449 RepID=A0ABU0AAQ1_9BACI|nr:rhodanese-related sulfurtransferase [Cytobacillus purgationiresistens]MDQ0268336.1 UPF0176 protein [Cytobacillus purgationiresistens]
MTVQKPYRLLLYYMYVPIESPEGFAKQHLKLCKSLELKGRILVAKEGINGTVSGTVENTEQYMKIMKADERFADMVFKVDEVEQHAFKKMHVRPRTEIVTLNLEDDVNPNEVTGAYLEPKEFYEAMQQQDTVVIDARNDYEYDIGHFRGAIRPDIEAFRDLPDWIRENNEILEGKKILTYCTGGIRCEKFSGWLVQEGYQDVSQLHGGIITYGKDPEVQGELWDGQCYVFDDRITVPINNKEHVVVGKDYFTGEPCERYINCANPECDKRFMATKENEDKYLRSCSHECRVHPDNLYVIEHELSEEGMNERIKMIEKEQTANMN